jgi:flavin reductase (DIM6/NTAB) family NADH-FMN oxidoreductase RutF
MADGGVSPEEFRAALGAYATGVTIVTAIGANGPSGATANAVTSLSLDPPMMLACLDRDSRTLTSVRAQGKFGVNALAAGQEEVARRFSGKDPEPAKWEAVEWSESEDLPRLDGALMWVACELRDLIDGGDHLILTGNVLAVESREGQPLLFHRGAYRDLLAES